VSGIVIELFQDINVLYNNLTFNLIVCLCSLLDGVSASKQKYFNAMLIIMEGFIHIYVLGQAGCNTVATQYVIACNLY